MQHRTRHLANLMVVVDQQDGRSMNCSGGGDARQFGVWCAML
jgi:hypothetical protein